MKRVLKELQLTHIAAVDRPCQEGALAVIMKRDFSDKERAEQADKGNAMPDGSFPIANTTDLANAVKAFGRAKDPAAVKRHIINRARALGATGSLPEDWAVKVGLADRLTKMMLGQGDEQESFDKAFDDLLVAAGYCDGDLVTKLEDQLGPIAEIVSDDHLTDLGKHDELYQGFDGFLSGYSKQHPEAMPQLEKALTIQSRIRKLKRDLRVVDMVKRLRKAKDALGHGSDARGGRSRYPSVNAMHRTALAELAEQHAPEDEYYNRGDFGGSDKDFFNDLKSRATETAGQAIVNSYDDPNGKNLPAARRAAARAVKEHVGRVKATFAGIDRQDR